MTRGDIVRSIFVALCVGLTAAQTFMEPTHDNVACLFVVVITGAALLIEGAE